MEVSTKELRIQPGRILDQVVNGQEVVVTYRGKPFAKIVPYADVALTSTDEGDDIFGMWRDHADKREVEETVRAFRQGRTF
jgi:prevent-host-death family protein